MIYACLFLKPYFTEVSVHLNFIASNEFPLQIPNQPIFLKCQTCLVLAQVEPSRDLASLSWCPFPVFSVPICIPIIAFMSARRSNQSILEEIGTGCSLEGMMLKLKLQYFGHLMRRVDSLEKTLMLEGLGAGGEGDDRGWDGWMASPTWWTRVWVNSGSWWWTGRPGMLWFMGSQRVRHDWATDLNWTELMMKNLMINVWVVGIWFYPTSHFRFYE